VRKKLNPNRHKQCFELFGFDYIIDEDFNVFLIECNTNPCLEESSKLLETLLVRMLNDAFKLTLDVHFPPLQRATSASGVTLNPGKIKPREKVF